MRAAPANMRSVRLAAWGGLVLLPMIRAALAVADLSVRAESLLSDVFVYLLPTALVVVATMYVAARTLGLLEHWLWGAVSISTATVLVGESHWVWYVANVDFHGPPMDSPIRLLYLIALALYVALFLKMIGFGKQPLVSKLRGVSDALGTMVYLYGLVYAYWALNAFTGLRRPIMNAVQSSLYPVVGIAMLVLIVWVVLGLESRRWHAWQTLFAISYTIYAVGLVAFTALYPYTMRAEKAAADFTSLALGAGMYLLFVAAVYRVTSGEDVAIVHQLHVRRRNAGWNFFPALLATGIPLFSWKSLQMDAGSALPLVVCSVLLAVLLSIRSWATALDFAQYRIHAITDSLTGVHNARYLRKRLLEVLDHAEAASVPVTMVLADIDGFRCLNNSYGHHSGDRVLRSFAEVVTACLPLGGELFRAGSDEFVIILPQQTADQAVALVSRIRAAALGAVSPNGISPVGISFGIAEYPLHASDAKALAACARGAERSVHHTDAMGIGVFDPASMVARMPSGTLEDVRARSLRDTVRALSAAVDARHPATRNHSGNVAGLAASLAVSLGLSASRVDVVSLAAQLHDIGKIGLPDSILFTPQPVSDSGLSRLEVHPVLGARILSSADMPSVTPVVRAHHERWDGRGYPDRLAAHDIPLEARILAVCDVYESLIAGRSYKPACEPSVAEAEIEAAAGTMFDPIVVQAFLTMMRRGNQTDWESPYPAADRRSQVAS